MARQLGYDFFECSALKNDEIDQIFKTVVEKKIKQTGVESPMSSRSPDFYETKKDKQDEIQENNVFKKKKYKSIF